MKYKTCVSIAETSPSKIKQTLMIALRKSELVEIRFDFLAPEKIPQVLEDLKKDLKKVVCTLRPTSEGGKFSGNEKERIAILKLIAEYNPFLLDVEFSTMKREKKLVEYLKKTKTNLLVSEHDFKKTPRFTELKNKLKNSLKFMYLVRDQKNVLKVFLLILFRVFNSL